MIPEIVNLWEINKPALEKYFKETKTDEYDSYKRIVEIVFALIINNQENQDYDHYDISKMTIIDDGDYQGTEIFFIPKQTYQPSIGDYIITHTYYGSCSGCDTLQGILPYSSDLPSDEQVKELMTLALHLIQNMKRLSDED